MKIHFTLILTLSLTIACGSKESSKEVNSESKNYSEIEQLYLDLPFDDYFGCEFTPETTEAFRIKNILNLKKNNNYLHASDSFDFNFEIKLFENKWGYDKVVAVFSRQCNIGGQCPPSYKFYNVTDNNWNDITSSVFKIKDYEAEMNLNMPIGYKIEANNNEIMAVSCEDESQKLFKIIPGDSGFKLVKE